jgi:hypothetical protein
MGTITDTFSDLCEVLISDYQKLTESKPDKATQRTRACDLLVSRVLRPILPSSIRLGMGLILDVKDRQAGAFDIIGGWELYPPLGEGMAHRFFIDGVVFTLQVRNWASDDLTQFGEVAALLKNLERRPQAPVFCAAVSFEPLPAAHVLDFLKSKPGQSADAVLCIGEYFTLRNSRGWFGNAQSIPFVTERGAGEALKAFTFLLLQLCQTFMGLPFSLADYQHL